MDYLIISVFYEIDNFCKKFISYMEQQCIQTGDNYISMELPSRLALNELMAICIVFRLSGYKTFKWYYKNLVSKDFKKFFPHLVSYNRFVELMPYTALPMVFFANSRCGKYTGISFVDSTTIDVCDSHRIQQHRVFKDTSQRGESSTGWFYSFKLHISINELMAVVKYWVSVLHQGIKMTGILEFSDKILLRKRAVIESVNDFLKNICQTGHSRHRSCYNFVTNLVSGIAAYSFLAKKPSIQPWDNAIPCKTL